MPHPERPTRIHPPTATGLYDPAFEHDACGVALVARLNGVPTHETVERALRAVANLEHRGAQGADPDTGDGAGILVQIPDAFFRGELGERLPAPGAYAVGIVLPPGRRGAAGARGAARRGRDRVRGAGAARLARRPGRPALRGHDGGRSRPVHAPGRRRRVRRPGRRPGRLRAEAVRHPPRSRSAPPGTSSSCRASPPAPSSTRGCSRRRSSPASSRICRIRGSRARSR